MEIVSLYNHPPNSKGRLIAVDIYRTEKRSVEVCIYPPLLTDPEGDCCFSTNQLDKKKRRHRALFAF